MTINIFWVNNPFKNFKMFDLHYILKYLVFMHCAKILFKTEVMKNWLKLTNTNLALTVGLHDISHAIVMRISSVMPVLWLVINLHHLFSNETAFNKQSRSSLTSYTISHSISNAIHLWFWARMAFTFMHLADAFIQCNLQCIQAIIFLSVCVFLGNWTHNLLHC